METSLHSTPVPVLGGGSTPWWHPSSVASHLQGYMCSCALPLSAIAFTFSLMQPMFPFGEWLTQPAFLMDLFE
ncbi:hypothetical protein AHAS_Ahas03G0266900 [Arachis hypogaea]